MSWASAGRSTIADLPKGRTIDADCGPLWPPLLMRTVDVFGGSTLRGGVGGSECDSAESAVATDTRNDL